MRRCAGAWRVRRSAALIAFAAVPAALAQWLPPWRRRRLVRRHRTAARGAGLCAGRAAPTATRGLSRRCPRRPRGLSAAGDRRQERRDPRALHRRRLEASAPSSPSATMEFGRAAAAGCRPAAARPGFSVAPTAARRRNPPTADRRTCAFPSAVSPFGSQRTPTTAKPKPPQPLARSRRQRPRPRPPVDRSPPLPPPAPREAAQAGRVGAAARPQPSRRSSPRRARSRTPPRRRRPRRPSQAGGGRGPSLNPRRKRSRARRDRDSRAAPRPPRRATSRRSASFPRRCSNRQKGRPAGRPVSLDPRRPAYAACCRRLDGFDRLAALVDRDGARLLRFGDLAHQIDVEQPVLADRAGRDHMVGKLETALEGARRDALIEDVALLVVLSARSPWSRARSACCRASRPTVRSRRSRRPRA